MRHVKFCRSLLQHLIDRSKHRFNSVPMYAVRGHMFPPVIVATVLPADTCSPRAAAVSLATTGYFVPLTLRINKLMFLKCDPTTEMTKYSCHCSPGRVPQRLSYIMTS